MSQDKKIIKVNCAHRPIPGLEAYFEPREWNEHIAKEDLERALASNGKICRVAKYKADGTKVSEMLQRMPKGLRDKWERDHGGSVIHICYLMDENGQFYTP